MAASPVTCPECGASVDAAQTRCWLCQGELIVQAELVDRAPRSAAIGPANREASALQFSLQSLLLVITLAAVCLGALVAAPPLGVLALIIAAPALVRTWITGAAARGAGSQRTLADKVMGFFASAAIAVAAFVAAGIAFFTSCTLSVVAAAGVGSVAGNAPGGADLFDALWKGGLAFCGISSVLAFIGMFWITWPAKRRSG